MVILGIILALFGWLLEIEVLLWIGVVLLVVGAVLLLVGAAGHSVGGRRHWY